MSNLVPTPLADKNGKIVTRHVRAAPQKNSSSLLNAAPKLKAEKAPSIPPSALKTYSDKVYINTVSEELESLKPKHSYEYALNQITDAMYYDVYNVASVSNATAFISAGIKTKEDALEYMHEHDLEHLIEDNAEMADALLHGGVSAVAFITSSNSAKQPLRPQKYHIDSLKVRSIKGFANSGIAVDVLYERIAYEDLRAVGVTRFNAFPDSTAERLWDINKGDVPYTAQELAQMIDKLHPKKHPYIGKDLLDSAIGMADVVGSSVILELDKPMSVSPHFHDLSERYSDADKLREALFYTHDILARSNEKTIQHHSLVQLFDAGIEPELASRVVDGEMTVDQAIATSTGEVSASVSSGWL